MTILDRLRRWFSRGRGDPVMSSPPQEAQFGVTSQGQENKLLDEGKTPRS
jgi:hypothetical protein